MFDSDKGLDRPPPPKDGTEMTQSPGESDTELVRQLEVDGTRKFNRLGWRRLTVVLFVEAIALGSLSLPAAFATLGMVAGVICAVGIGFIATYASYEIGAVKLKHPEIENYGDIGRLLLGEWGFWLVTLSFMCGMLLNVGSHCLTGTIAWADITQSDVCGVVFGAVSAVILFVLAIPPAFADIAILGYIDIVSILVAIGITLIATGVQKSNQPGGLQSSDWSAWPAEDIDFSSAMVAINNLVFAYSFAIALPSFMSEMHTPKDYVKSVCTLGAFQTFLYTVIGSVIYVFVGQAVQAPALLSAGPVVSRIAFGIALPVIFISGSINISIGARYIHGNMYRNSLVRYVNSKRGWVTWIILVAVCTTISWIVSEAIPVFTTILSISGALLNSGLCFYVPAVVWFVLVREGSWYSRRNLLRATINLLVFLFGIGILGCGMYANIVVLVRYCINRFDVDRRLTVFSDTRDQGRCIGASVCMLKVWIGRACF